MHYTIILAIATEVKRMTNNIKKCDTKKSVALEVFKMLNDNRVKVIMGKNGAVIVTNIEPKNLIYPEGWYYNKGKFCRKNTDQKEESVEVEMINLDGNSWKDYADYATPH